ncbi:hypothetical protein V7S43_009183 [Phytophthora oleae]|uniref:WD40 repeat-like protein n=1 Tax=Phytophthora oleae TaxID=2107226 RepID=A0ABD3FG51_9STRA
MHLDESHALSRKRHRSSKKKRLRRKKRASLEVKITVEEDEIRRDKHEEAIIQDQTEDSDQEPGEEEHHTPQNPKITSQYHSQEQSVQVRTQVEEKDQDTSDEDDDELTEYERKRRKNILRNQAYLKSVGMSTAKFVARTSIGYEAEKVAKKQLRAEKRALRVAEEKTPQRTHIEEKYQDASDEDDDELTEYELKRRENILRNQAYLNGVGMSTAKFAARTSIGCEAEKDAKKQLLAKKRALRAAEEESPQSPQRRSLRIRKKATVLAKSRLRSANTRVKSAKVPVSKQQIDLGHPLDILEIKGMRQPTGSTLYVMDATDDEGKEFCNELAGGVDTFETNEAGDDVDYTLADTDMVKALPYCTTTMAVLPRADRIVVAAGDKEGHVALWSPSSDSSGSDAALSRPHGYPVSHLIFPDSSTLISSSIDGTVREFDFWTATTSPIGDLSHETGITSLTGSGNPQFYYAGCEDGTLRLVDRRARMMFNALYSLHEMKINSVDQHPSLDFCIATASRDATVCLWDKRKISSEKNVALARLLHTKEVTSAHFSPGGDSWLAAVGKDSYFDMYDTSNLANCKESGKNAFTIPNWVRIPHSTYTEKPTNIRPAWDPKRKDRFVIACLDKPARLQIFRAGQKQPIQELTSPRLSRNPRLVKQHSADLITAYHPSLDIIASSNSIGVISLWRAKPKT